MLSKKLCLFTILVALVVAFGATAAQAGAKVEICHLPPGNPANFHTITVSENALTAHYGHGDLPGSCYANCETLCDDGDACSIDACDEATETCLADHPPVDCDDGSLCTTDSCDSADGCQYAPIACDDGKNCTVDTCNPYDGQCTGTPIDCGPLGVCVAETGQCDFPCDGITCDPIDQCHEAGECVLPGECLDGAAVADGTACDDGDAGTENDACSGGVCAGTVTTPACPCEGTSNLNGTATWDSTFEVQRCGANNNASGFAFSTSGDLLIVFDASCPGGPTCGFGQACGVTELTLTPEEVQSCVDSIFAIAAEDGFTECVSTG